MELDDRASGRTGRSWPGRARLIIDNGAYSMDEPFLGQMAAMFAVGPYRIPHVDVAADVVYTNTQPSGSVRAPTGPTTCWALEQHHDVVAERLGLDPVEFRRRNLVHEGDEGPTGQVFERIGVIETLEHAAASDRLGPAARGRRGGRRSRPAGGRRSRRRRART